MSIAPNGLDQPARWAEPGLCAVLEAIPDAIILVDADGRIVMTNEQTCGVFGYAAGELTGLAVERLLPERHRRHHAHERERFKAAPRARSIGELHGLQALRKDGSEFPVEISLGPLATPAGMLVCTVVRDISERQRLDRSLREKSLQAESAGREKEQFLAGMSHELRTPLNAIVGFTGTLLMRLAGPLTADQENQLKTIQGSARQLVGLINDLLDVAKLDANEVGLRREWFDCRGLVLELADGLRPAAAAKGLELGVPAVDGATMVFTDRQILRQILGKLVENAIRFTAAGAVLVSVARLESAEPAQLQITVADSGPGIPGQSLDRLFEPFPRSETGGVPRGAGSGLGLHLSRKLAIRLGGTLTGTSGPGGGCHFTVRLPAE